MIQEERVRPAGLDFSTRVLKSGSGAPVLLLHGSPDSASEWGKVMEALGGACACFAPDLPGLGACDEPPLSYDYSRKGSLAFLDGLRTALGIREPLILVVHDVGGVFAVPWCAQRPGLVKGLVVTNTVVFERFPWFPLARLWGRSDALGRAMASAFMAQVGWFGGGLFRRAYARVSPELSAEDVARVTREFALNPVAKRSTLRQFRAMVPHGYFDGYGAMVESLATRLPMRVVWGLGDPYIPESYARAFPGVPTESLNGAGHWVPLSAPQRVAAAVQELALLQAAP